jgi:hypothetical protein
MKILLFQLLVGMLFHVERNKNKIPRRQVRWFRFHFSHFRGFWVASERYPTLLLAKPWTAPGAFAERSSEKAALTLMLGRDLRSLKSPGGLLRCARNDGAQWRFPCPASDLQVFLPPRPITKRRDADDGNRPSSLTGDNHRTGMLF